MSKKKNFRQEWRSLTEIGNIFGISARKLGSLLKKYGLRESDGKPSESATDRTGSLKTIKARLLIQPRFLLIKK